MTNIVGPCLEGQPGPESRQYHLGQAIHWCHLDLRRDSAHERMVSYHDLGDYADRLVALELPLPIMGMCGGHLTHLGFRPSHWCHWRRCFLQCSTPLIGLLQMHHACSRKLHGALYAAGVHKRLSHVEVLQPSAAEARAIKPIPHHCQQHQEITANLMAQLVREGLQTEEVITCLLGHTHKRDKVPRNGPSQASLASAHCPDRVHCALSAICKAGQH